MGRIVAIDPGKTTGVAILNSSNKIERMAQYIGFSWIDNLKLMRGDVLVWENYFNSGVDFDTSGVEIIGALKYVVARFDLDYKIQQPSVPSFMTTRYGLKGMRLNCGIHEKEALLHALYYKHKQLKDEQILEVMKSVKHYKGNGTFHV